MLPGALKKLGGIEKVMDVYRELLQLYAGNATGGGERCSSTWPLSTRNLTGARRPGLIINLGAGTTGTRFLDCLVDQSFDLKTGHNIDRREFDRYDYISDSPVPYSTVQLLLSHPGNLTAGVLLSLRDPFEWVQSRIGHHGSDHCCSVPTAPCGKALHMSGGKKSKETFAMHFFVYQAWAACLGSSPQLGYKASHLFAFNLFEQLPADLEDELYTAMRHFAPRRQSPSSEHTKRRFKRAWEECREGR